MERKYALLIVLAFLAGAVGIAILTGATGSSTREPAKPILTEESELFKAFSTLRDIPTKPAPHLTRSMERVVEGADFGLDLNSAHPAVTNTLDQVWIVPGHGYICVMGSDPIVAGCDTTARAIRDGVSVVAITPAPGSRDDKRYFLFGIAPDGVRQVTIHSGDGTEVGVPVARNVYSYTASSMIRAELR